MVVHGRLHCIFGAAVLLSCQGGGARDSGPVVRDSAGVRIVENTQPMERAGAWVVEREPTLVIGGMNADEAHTLFRVSAAMRLSDFGIVVANEGSRELRFYDADGRHKRSVGRRGQGPGEFEAIAWVRPYRADSLVAYDSRLRRFTVFDAEGAFGRDLSLEGVQGGPITPLGPLSDGTLIALQLAPLEGPPAGIVRRDETVRRFSADGAPMNELGVFPGRESFANRAGGDLLLVAIPFARWTSYAISGMSVLAATNDTYEIDALSATGATETIVRRAMTPVQPTEADARDLIENQLAAIPDSVVRERRRRTFEGLPHAENKPMFGDILVDRMGHLWVQRYDPMAEGAPTFDVFAADGSWLTTVELPGGVRPFDIGEDYVVGRSVTELGVEQVSVYRLNRAR